MKQKNVFYLILIAIGIYAFVLSNKCNSFVELDFESIERYGGDAYTGIQNAAARTSQNVSQLAEIVKFGFTSLLRIIALILIGLGVSNIAILVWEKMKTNIQEGI